MIPMPSRTARVATVEPPLPETDEQLRDALVATFRARLAGLESPLDRVSRQELEQARLEFSALPEVAGEPLPDPQTSRRSKARG
jgi:hypothetical protein